MLLGVFLGIYLVLGCGLIPDLILVPIAGLVYFGAGWFWFLQRVGPQIQISPAGILLGLGALAALVIGVQLAVRAFAPRRTWPLGRTVRSVIGVLAACLGGICLVGLTHEASWWGRSKEPWVRRQIGRGLQAAIRVQSKNNLKNIGLAVHNYQDAFTVYPPGGIFSAEGTAGHGWMAFSLPYVDHASLYNTLNFNVPWYDPVNRAVYQRRIAGYENPKLIGRMDAVVGPYAPGHYAANGRLLHANRGSSFAEITDGTSHTIFAGEVKDNIRPWGHVVNWRDPELGINRSPHGFGSPFSSGAHLLMTDGAVHFVSENIDRHVLKALATPAGGEPVGDY